MSDKVYLRVGDSGIETPLVLLANAIQKKSGGAWVDAWAEAQKSNPGMVEQHMRLTHACLSGFDERGLSLEEKLAVRAAGRQAAESFAYVTESRGVAAAEFSEAVVALARQMVATKLSGADGDLLLEVATFVRERSRGPVNRLPLMLAAGI